MSDYDNAMTAGPALALKQHVNAFRAGRAEANSSEASPGKASPPARGFESPAWNAVRAHVEGMSDGAKALAARNAEILTVAAQGLAGRTYAERKAIMVHMAPHLAALGVGGEDGGGAIKAFDPTDTNIAQAVGEAAILRGMLGGAPNEASTNAPVTIGPGGQSAPAETGT
ncbi:MAG TPA: hypothetical protein VGF71_00670 [Caulobacteraceae bacterium]